MKRSFIKIKTAWSLGPANVFYVILHRLKAKTGLDSTRYLHASIPLGPFFTDVELVRSDLVSSKDWHQEALYFGWWSRPVTDAPPNWHQNPMNQEQAVVEQMWWQLPDFDARVGDIKLVWEASRFSWVLAFAQRVSLGDAPSLIRLNEWLADWCIKNPPYRGANWKCGQESAIRVLHLAMASLILGQGRKPLPGVINFVKMHLQRIAPTLRYAMSQDNNHGTSEAAALFVGGSWLEYVGLSEGRRWQKIGRKWLENRAIRLIGVDGSFSQYSVNYHRVVLDTFSIVEVWRKHLALPAFSASLQQRLVAASRWLATFVAPNTGDAPNLGANDSARLLPLTDGHDRDFRPSVQMAMVLFAGYRAYAGQGDWNWPLQWLGIALPDAVMSVPVTQLFDNGGYAVLRNNRVMAVLRYPRFLFRPSQADLLHVDLWKDGINLLRDAGTYSYHTEPEYLGYFPGTIGHNTIQFDNRDQMPRLSRFLFGNWLKTDEIERLSEDEGGVSFAASYRDAHGAYHKRRVILTEHKLKVCDEIDGFTSKAVLRWRLAQGDWKIEGTGVRNQQDYLNIQATMPIIKIQLVSGWESRHYLQKTDTPILEIEVEQPGIIISEYEWML